MIYIYYYCITVYVHIHLADNFCLEPWIGCHFAQVKLCCTCQVRSPSMDGTSMGPKEWGFGQISYTLFNLVGGLKDGFRDS